MRRAFVALLALVASMAHADAWTGKDKGLHIAAGYAASAVATQALDSKFAGFAFGTAVGLLKEMRDATGRGQVSAKDFFVTAAGAALGSYTSGVLLARQDGRTVLMFSREF